MSEQAPKSTSDLVMGEYSSVEQKKYNNGAVHIYGVDPETGKKNHLSHEQLLNAYGHSSKERDEYNKAYEAEMLDADEEDLDEELLDDWNDLKDSFAEARSTGDIDALQSALNSYKVYIDQFEDMSDEDKKTSLKELLDGSEYVGKHEKTDESQTDDKKSNEEPKHEGSGEDSGEPKEEKADEAPLHNVGDEFQEMLEDGVAKTWAIESIGTDESGNTIYTLRDENGTLYEKNLTAEELSNFNKLTRSDSSEDEPTVHRTLRQRLTNWLRNPGAAASAEAQARMATTNPETRRKYLRPVIYVLGAAAAIYAFKLGIDYVNSDSAQVASDAAGAAGGIKPPGAETAVKLTETQKNLLSADGAYPWDRFAEVFGKKMASSEIFEAVDKLQAQGVKIIEHGARNSSQYWIEVPKPGGGMTSNTDTVMRVLTKGV